MGCVNQKQTIKMKGPEDKRITESKPPKIVKEADISKISKVKEENTVVIDVNDKQSTVNIINAGKFTKQNNNVSSDSIITKPNKENKAYSSSKNVASTNGSGLGSGIDSSVNISNVPSSKNVKMLELLELVDSRDYMYPYFLEVGNNLIIFVSGLLSIDSEESKEYKYYEENTHKLNGFPYGCLLGRIMGGPYFMINTKTDFVCEHKGPLFIGLNINELSHSSVQMQLKLKINQEKKTYSQIDTMLGWKCSQIKANFMENSVLEEETEVTLEKDLLKKFYFDLFSYISKFRMNPQKFFSQYLSQYLSIDTSSNQELQTQKDSAIELKSIINTLKPINTVLKYHKKCEQKSESISKEAFNASRFSDDLMDTIIQNIRSKRDYEGKSETNFFFHEYYTNPLYYLVNNLFLSKDRSFTNMVLNEKYEKVGIHTNHYKEYSNYLTIITFVSSESFED